MKQSIVYVCLQVDLIYLGVKYFLCMRRDDNIWEGIYKDRVEEKESACCIRDDGLGCVQFVKIKCSVSCVFLIIFVFIYIDEKMKYCKYFLISFL